MVPLPPQVGQRPEILRSPLQVPHVTILPIFAFQFLPSPLQIGHLSFIVTLNPLQVGHSMSSDRGMILPPVTYGIYQYDTIPYLREAT